jgi:hypothetical protein
MAEGNRKILVYQPLYMWLTVAAGTALALALVWLVFDQGKRFAAGELVDLRRERRALREEVDSLQRTNFELREKVAVLQRSAEIDRRASLEVRDEFADLQGELTELRNELQFYRSIVAPGDARAGLKVQRLRVEPGESAGSFRFSVTLVQVKHNDRYVRGAMEIELEGEEDGVTKLLSLPNLVKGEAGDMNYRFRYFQRFDSEIELPERFHPRRVHVRLKPSGKGQPPGIEEVMEWPA